MSDPATGSWGPEICKEGGKGLFFPALEGEYEWPGAMRIVMYTVALLYLFLGMDLISKKFMESIMAITSKQLRVTKASGRTVTVRRWNPTVANVTLIAIGSAAPEILLSCVEVSRRDFYISNLGPSTVVGSSAFNLFVIVAACIWAIPLDEVREVKEVQIFQLTAVFSICVYIWVVLILHYFSPGVIDIWEGVFTLALFPLLVLLAYVFDGHSGLPEQAQKSLYKSLGWEDEEVDDGEEGEVRAAAGDDGEDSDVSVGDDGEDKQNSLDTKTDNILDVNGRALTNSAGVLTFDEDELEVEASYFGWTCPISVHRRNNSSGEICCSYRTVALSAMPGYDFVHAEGELVFPHDAKELEIPIEILPKKIFKVADQFQIILDNAEGGVIFNPNHDGGYSRAVLTVTIVNASMTQADWDEEYSDDPRETRRYRIMNLLDESFNLDKFNIATSAWMSNIGDALFSANGKSFETAGPVDWVLYLFFFPWKSTFAFFIPPALYGDGWFSFCVCLIAFGVLAAAILDFAELFGCLVGIKDGITAITLVAIGCAMPDLLATKRACKQDESADASIVSITLSNCVMVLLGIGIPWTIGALYWKANGVTEPWKDRYPEYVLTHPQGAFIVDGADITVTILIYTVFACAAFATIRIRRVFYGGELGGSKKIKAASTIFLVCLWVVYILVSMYDMQFKDADLGAGVGKLINVENTFFLVGVGINMGYILVCLADIFDSFHG